MLLRILHCEWFVRKVKLIVMCLETVQRNAGVIKCNAAVLTRINV